MRELIFSLSLTNMIIFPSIVIAKYLNSFNGYSIIWKKCSVNWTLELALWFLNQNNVYASLSYLHVTIVAIRAQSTSWLTVSRPRWFIANHMVIVRAVNLNWEWKMRVKGCCMLSTCIFVLARTPLMRGISFSSLTLWLCLLYKIS